MQQVLHTCQANKRSSHSVPYFLPSYLDTKYCAVCTPLGKLYPNKYPITLNWKEDLKKEEERQEWVKEDNYSVCSDLDADPKEQEWKNLEMEDQKNNDRKTP